MGENSTSRGLGWSEPTLRTGFDRHFVHLREGAVARELGRTLPTEEFKVLAKARFGALRLPKEQGGFGVSLSELYRIIEDLAFAEPNVAHALRNHFGLVERFLWAPEGSVLRRELPKIADGEIFAFSYTEADSPAAGTIGGATYLRPQNGGYSLTGRRQYSTGNLYADWLWLFVKDENGANRNGVIPLRREGIDLTDDWGGFGQKLTGSGSTIFNNVRVEESELIPFDDPSHGAGPKYTSNLNQLYLTTIIAGIVRAIRADAIAEVHRRTRNYHHGLTENAADDANVQTVLGDISAQASAVSAVVRDAAQTLEAAHLAGGPGQYDDDAIHAAALQVSKAKVVVDQLAQKVAGQLFDVGGASAIQTGLAYDRHWRNIRVIASHNPHTYKQRLIGAYELRGTPLPIATFF